MRPQHSGSLREQPTEIIEVGARGYTWPRFLGTLLGLIGFMLAFSKGMSLLLHELNPSPPDGRNAVIFADACTAELLALGILLLLLRRRGMVLGDLGLGRRTTWYAVVIGVLVALVYAAATAMEPTGLVAEHAFTFSWLKLAIVPPAILAGTVEEILCRGYAMTIVRSVGCGRVLQVVVGAVSFGLGHPAFSLAGMAATLLLGAALGVVYLLGNRSLTPVIIAHVLVDLIIEPGLILSTMAG